MRNLHSKVPDAGWPEFQGRVKAAYPALSREVARMMRDVLATEYEKCLPSAIKGFLDDFGACIAHLQFPIAHRPVIEAANLLERLIGEGRRRMKIVTSALGERAFLELMYAASIGAELDTEYERRHLAESTTPEGVSPSRISGKTRNPPTSVRGPESRS